MFQSFVFGKIVQLHFISDLECGFVGYGNASFSFANGSSMKYKKMTHFHRTLNVKISGITSLGLGTIACIFRNMEF